MRVLLTTDSFEPNVDGAAVFVERLAQSLLSKDVQVEVVAPSPSLKSYTTEEMGVRVHRRAAWRPFKRRGMLVAVNPAVKEIILSFQPTVIHINLPYTIGLDALRAAKHFELPVLATNHVVIEGISWAAPLASPLTKMIENAVRSYLLWFYRQCNAVAVPTVEARAMLIGESDESMPLEIISNGVDLELFKPRPPDPSYYEKLGLPRGKALVLYAGRLEVEKSMDVWLRAAAEVRGEVDAHFAIAGTGTMQDELMALAQELGLADHVTFLGSLSSYQLSRLHNLSAVFLICSPTESQSIATLEAIASGLPVVAVDAGALPELVHDGRNGFLVRPGDEREIATCVQKILCDCQLRRALAEESRRIALAHSFDKTADLYLALYRALA